MSEPKIFSDSFVAFNVQCDVVLPGMDADQAKQILQKIKNETSRIELAVSRSEAVSEIGQVNALPKNEWIEVSDEFWEILTISSEFYTMSNGAFDVTYAPLFDGWKSEATLTADQITKLKAACGFDKLEIDAENQRFRFLADDMQLDFGALEKAYALEILKDLFRQEGISNAIISMAEESVLAQGHHPQGEAWPMGVRNLNQPHEFVHVFSAIDQVVCTTGTEYIDMETGERKPRKLLSPETGEIVKGRKAVSVKATSALMATFISYVWLILPESDKSIIADQLKGIEIMECEYLADDVKTKHTLIEEP